MASLLKDLYSPGFFQKFTAVAIDTIPLFDPKKFDQLIYDSHWDKRELKDRMRHISTVLHHFLPEDFPQASEHLQKLIKELKNRSILEHSLEFMFIPDYIEKYGIDHPENASHLIEFVTPFTSCEFAVRPFIIKYGDSMLERMYKWSLHEDLHVRRLASEGSRPRLPWAIALPELKKDPSAILPLLENLKTDPSEYVRRSVANTINDISKDNPAIVIDLAKSWKGIGKETDAIIKHGCRTLLKQGHKEILKHYGLSGSHEISIQDLQIHEAGIKIGEDLKFSFSVINNHRNEQNVRLEYGIYFLRQNGQWNRKVFKISERLLGSGEKAEILKKQSFKLITTRKFYPGLHKLSLILNGQERVISEFELCPG